MKKVVTFGEIMLRFSPPGYLRFSQTNSFDVIYGGGESNVAVSLANYGVPVRFVTRDSQQRYWRLCPYGNA
jgi:2-dehydro-3-deoxygluconokinase